MASASEFIIDDAIVVRYAFNNHVIRAQDVTDLTIQSIIIYSSWSMGFYTLRTRRLNVIDYHVSRRDARWLSTSVDCMHFADSREYINIFDSQCQSMGDDGLNVHATYFSVAQVINSSTLVIQSLDSSENLDIGVGTHLELSSYAQPFTGYTTATVSSLSMISSHSRLFTFDNPVNASLGDWACVADTPALTIRNFTVANNRGRGLLLESRNVHVTRSIFDGISGSAVYFQPSMF